MTREDAKQRAWTGVFAAYLVLLVVVVLSQNTIATYIVLAPLVILVLVIALGLVIWIGQGVYALATGKVEEGT